MNISKWARRGVSALVAVTVPMSLVASSPAIAAGGKGGGGKAGGGSATTFVGRASGVLGTVLGQSVALPDVSLPKKGGALEKSLVSLQAPGIEADVAHVSTIGQGLGVASEASLADVDLDILGALGINLLHLDAGFLMSNVWAKCENGLPRVGGWLDAAELELELNVLHTTIELEVTGVLDELLFDADLPVLGHVRIVANERVVSGGTIIINGLHVTVPLAGIDLVLSHAKAGIKCGLPGIRIGDFVTGGGWIETADGKANFAIAGGKKVNGECWWGHLLYNDKNGTRVRTGQVGSCDIAAVLGGDSVIRGTTSDGQPFTALAVDVDEPGRGNDVFGLNLNATKPVGTIIGGGNIQLHRSS